MREIWDTGFGLFRFCQVCSYWLVDKVDPVHHVFVSILIMTNFIRRLEHGRTG